MALTKKLSERENVYIVVWSGTEILRLYCDGSTFFIPRRDEFAETGRGSRYRFPAATSRVGNALPGTIVVRDEYGIVEGNRARTFEAYEFVKFIENTRQDLLDRGLALIEMPEEYEAVMAEGIQKFERSEDSRAQEILQTELQRRKTWEEKGVPAPISSSDADVQWARRHLEERQTLQQSKVSSDDIRSVLSGLPPVPAPRRLSMAQPQPQPQEAATGGSGPALYKQATNLGIDFKKTQLSGLMVDDPEIVREVQILIAARMDALKAIAAPAQETPSAP